MIQRIKLGDMAEIFAGARISRYNTGVTEKMKVLKRTQKNSYQLDYDEVDLSTDLNPKFFSKKNDIIVLLAGSNNIIKLDEEGYVIPMYYAVIRVKEGFDADFIYHLLKTEIFPRELNRLVEGTTLKIIKTHYLKEMILPIPEFERQSEIGELLGLMDRRIKLKKESVEIEEKLLRYMMDLDSGVDYNAG